MVYRRLLGLTLTITTSAIASPEDLLRRMWDQHCSPHARRPYASPNLHNSTSHFRKLELRIAQQTPSVLTLADDTRHVVVTEEMVRELDQFLEREWVRNPFSDGHSPEIEKHTLRAISLLLEYARDLHLARNKDLSFGQKLAAASLVEFATATHSMSDAVRDKLIYSICEMDRVVPVNGGGDALAKLLSKVSTGSTSPAVYQYIVHTMHSETGSERRLPFNVVAKLASKDVVAYNENPTNENRQNVERFADYFSDLAKRLPENDVRKKAATEITNNLVSIFRRR